MEASGGIGSRVKLTLLSEYSCSSPIVLGATSPHRLDPASSLWTRLETHAGALAHSRTMVIVYHSSNSALMSPVSGRSGPE